MKLDIKGLKKVSSDSKKTILQHPKGHQIMVAHAALSKPMLDKLSKLPAMYMNPSNVESGGGQTQLPAAQYADGGYAEDFKGVQRKIGEWATEGKTQRQLEAERFEADPRISKPEGVLPEEVKQAPQNFYVGGEAKFKKPETDQDKEIEQSGERLLSGSADQLNKQNSALNAKDGGSRKTDYTAQDVQAEINKAPVPVDQAAETNRGVVGAPSPMATPVASTEEALGSVGSSYASGEPMAPVPPFQLPKALASDPYSQAAQMELSGLQKQAEAIQKGAVATGYEKGREAAAYDIAANTMNRQMALFQDNLNKQEAERKALMDDAAKGHLDPRQLIRNMSTGSKVMAGIGLFLGGIGSGMTGQPNLAYQMMEKAIDQDIEAQKTNIGLKTSLLQANLNSTKNLMDAAQLTKAQMMDITAMNINKIAATYADPIKRAEAEAGVAAIMQKAGAIYTEIAKRQAMIQAGQIGGESGFQRQMQTLRTMGPDAAKYAEDLEKKHVPGLGQATREVPPNVLAEIGARRDVHNAIMNLEDFARKNSGSLNPAVIKQGAAMAKLVQNKMRAGEHMGVIKDSEVKFMDTILKDPTVFLAKYRALPGYNEVKKANLSALNATLGTYGLPKVSEITAGAVEPKTVRVISPDGKAGTIPYGNLEKAKKLGYKVAE